MPSIGTPDISESDSIEMLHDDYWQLLSKVAATGEEADERVNCAPGTEPTLMLLDVDD
ncbi:hypothetical protein GCM10022268_28060 [Sphingomonas cynarae]|uniref:Uncharacterized protein n=1 Tax=Sphingomonas cynarae TaxID=930197 RepID=A0ABP7EG53_9SPHN